MEQEYCEVMRIPPEGSRTTPRPRARYSNRIFGRIVESYQMWLHKQVPPSVQYLGKGGQNPLLMDAFRWLMAADHRKSELEDVRQKNQADADAAAARAAR